ncbi:Glycyl-tRNA synthetase beta chain [Imhoffiella purpurea]|uniref:Glycine--tRNA ligase beta subunit n=1 Tax=Imhoffiella purpurea TaxID=1249627 RepID=W9VC20_9GAMM|nr:Glycyl-tRNA synthetase beta chain [Imhoffiella purpurea]
MDTFADLLIEIGTEELPPIALPALSKAFADEVESQFEGYGISYGSVERFATPRRLAVLVRELQTKQSDQETVRRGPAVRAAFDDSGAPTKAALGFARSCGVEIGDLDREATDKGEWLIFKSVTPGQETASLVPAIAEKALASLPIPKRMRWGDRSEEFVRPVHWVCLVMGSDPVKGSVLGLQAAPQTRGHRFHHPETIAVGKAADYERLLEDRGHVEASFDRRRASIEDKIRALASEQGLTARIDPALLDEVTGLVEWPQPLLCHFDSEYLEIPPEVLIETMQSNQKYFPLEDAEGRLQSAFIVITNLESKDPDQVRAGNERVIRPRFADAAFFWSQDIKQPLESFAKRLETVVFQDKLGTIADKSARVARLGRHLAASVEADPDLVERSAGLAKCDLVSSMVYEFPGLQGIMGRYYATHSNEDPCVCQAMQEQYLPRFAGDMLPSSPCGRALAIADRIDTLVGIFGIGLRPTGTKDPYALRRASIAVLRILIETPVDLDLEDLLKTAAEGFEPGILADDTVETVLAYMLDRLRGYYGDRDIPADVVESVVHVGVTNAFDIDRRIAAVSRFLTLASASELAAANKRIRNILAKADPGVADSGEVVADLLTDPAEIALAETVSQLAAKVLPLVEQRNYVETLECLADIKDDIDRFFTEVMVMADDEAVRNNRIHLLASVAELFLKVADISRLQ